jgi:biopolymer transport protein ExbB/TolQ
MILSPVIALFATISGMKGAFGALDTSGADVDTLLGQIGNVLVATTIGLGISAVMFIWMVSAIIRFCRLPAPVEAAP